uniref:Uncharacterized protein n=1 Tax=Panagrolaimus sp. PS1159 TaxID=55785 RepID=A0AC35F1H9_9BILA
MLAYQDEYLYEFPSFPDLSREDRRRLTYTTMLIFTCTEYPSITDYEIDEYVKYSLPINSLTHTPYYGPYETTLEEFLKLPEIACIVYPVHLSDTYTNEEYRYFQSYMKLFDEPRSKYFNFRFCIVQAFKEAGKNGLLKKMGTLSLEDLCTTFNGFEPIYRAFKWKINCQGGIPFLDNRTLINALCTFCSRDLVIRFHTRKPVTIRLRNHPDYLIQKQIEDERELSEKALNFYYRYRRDNPENIDWKKQEEVFPWKGVQYESRISSYKGFLTDNVYAAIHYYPSVQSSEAICTFIQAKLLSRCRLNLTQHKELNLLLDLLSSNSLAPLKFWDKEKIEVYMGVVEELSKDLDEINRNFLFDFIQLTTNKSPILATYSLWAFNTMAKHILSVTQGTKFVSADEIAEAINLRYKYDINIWLMYFNISSVDNLFEKKELSSHLSAIYIKYQAGIHFYRNIQSIMNDENLYPEAKLSKAGTDGFVNDKTLNELYHFCYHRNLDAFEKMKLFGQNYDSVFNFWEEFDCAEISVIINSEGEVLYGIKEDFTRAYEMVIEHKKKCYKSVKFWIELQKKDFDKKQAGPQSDFSALKKTRLNYDMEVHKATRGVLTRL